jgi:hypothetical protein
MATGNSSATAVAKLTVGRVDHTGRIGYIGSGFSVFNFCKYDEFSGIWSNARRSRSSGDSCIKEMREIVAIPVGAPAYLKA